MYIIHENKIKEHRELKGISIEALSLKSGVPVSVIQQIEAEEIPGTPHKLMLLKTALEDTGEDLDFKDHGFTPTNSKDTKTHRTSGTIFTIEDAIEDTKLNRRIVRVMMVLLAIPLFFSAFLLLGVLMIESSSGKWELAFSAVIYPISYLYAFLANRHHRKKLSFLVPLVVLIISIIVLMSFIN